MRTRHKHYCTYIPSPGASLLPPAPISPTLGHHRALNWAFCTSGNTKGLISRCQGIQTHWLKTDIWLVLLYFFVCWRDYLFDLTLIKYYWGLFWTQPQPWPINIWTNSLKHHPWDGPNPSYSVCLWKLKSTICYLFQATSAEGAPLSQSLGWQEPNFDNSQLTNPDGFHRD